MKEFRISDSLVIRRDWDGSEMRWFLVRRMDERCSVISLSNEEASVLVTTLVSEKEEPGADLDPDERPFMTDEDLG